MSLRRSLLLPLDDLLAVVHEFLNPNASRSGLDRCLRRHGVSNLRDLKGKAPKPTHKPFKAYEPCLHIDVQYLPQMADETRHRHLFVAIDRATRWVFIRIYGTKTAANARRFLRDLERACPLSGHCFAMPCRAMDADHPHSHGARPCPPLVRGQWSSGKEFTDRLFGLRKRAATGAHQFDRLCADPGIEHRLTPPMRPRTNGMVERFSGRIEDVLQSHHFNSREDLEQTLMRYLHLYNTQLPQSALKARTSILDMKEWYSRKPELFGKRPYYFTGCDT